MTAGVGEDHDNTFSSTYKDMDTGYNKIINANKDFVLKYNTTIKINDSIINELSYSDVYLSQRIMQKRQTNINILNLTTNKISIEIRDKNTNKIMQNIDAKIVLTRPSTNKDNFEFDISKSNEAKEFKIDKKAYWNIMGIIKINKDEGHFFIKTNSK